MIYLQRAPVNGRQSLGLASLVGLVALLELLVVLQSVEYERATRLKIEHALWRQLVGNLLRLVKQFQRFLRVVVLQHTHNIHIDRWCTLTIARLLHHLDDLLETTLRLLLVATVAIDMPQHVVGHIHLLVQLLLAQLCRQLACRLVCLKDFLRVHHEHYLVAALRIVSVYVVLPKQIVLQFLDVAVEAHLVSVVKRLTHRVA